MNPSATANHARSTPPGPDERWPVVAVGIALIAVVALRFGQELVNPSGMEPPLPDVYVHTLSDDTLRLADLQGDVVLVNFWATWCAPCLTEMPLLQRAWERHRDAGLHVIGLAVDDGPLTDFVVLLREQGVAYPLAFATPAAERAVGFDGTVPTTVLLDRRGRVVERVAGTVDPIALEMAVLRAVGTEE